MLKKLLCCLCIGIMTVSLAACGGKKDKDAELKTYEYNQLELNLNEDDGLSKIKLYGDDLYFVTYQYPEYPKEYEEELEKLYDSADDIEKRYQELQEKYSDYKTKIVLWKYNLTSSEKTAVYQKESDNYTIEAYSIADDGSIIMLNSEYIYDMKNDTSENVFSLNKIGADGSEQLISDLKDCIKKDGENEGYVSNAEFAPDGTLYISYEVSGEEKSTAYYSKISPDGQLIGTMQNESSDGSGAGFVIDGQANLLVGMYGEKGITYQTVDFDNNKLSDPLPGFESSDEESFSEYNVCSFSEEYGLLVKDSIYLYSYDADAGKLTPVLKWMDCGVVGNNVDNVLAVDGETFLCSFNDDMGKVNVGMLNENTSENDNKEVITLAGLYMDDTLQKSVISFNKASDKYKIQCNTYENSSDPQEAFINDIMAGNIPDIIDLSEIDVKNYISKGLLADLTPYMDKDDVINKDYFIDGILDKTAVDGKQYYLMNSFSIWTIAGKASELAQYKDNWTMDSFIEYYKSKPEGTMMFEFDSKELIFSLLFEQQFNSYVNWDTGEVTFDSDTFKKFLEFCNTFPKSEEGMYDDMSQDTHKLIKEGKQLFEYVYISSLDDITLQTKLFDDDIEFIGYPGAAGNRAYIAYPRGCLSISSTAKNPDAAWEFIKHVFMEQAKGVNADVYNIPTSKALFDNMIKKATTTEAYTDENGNLVEPRNTTMGYNDFEVEIGPATEAEVNTLKELINNAGGIISGTGKVQEMVSEEVYKYFEGQKSLDETVDIVQDKMKKYINENR